MTDRYPSIRSHDEAFSQKFLHDSLQIELGDNGRYQVKGTGSISFQLVCNNTLTLGKVLLVPGLKKNLISVSALEDKGMRIAFMKGKILMWPKRLQH